MAHNQQPQRPILERRLKTQKKGAQPGRRRKRQTSHQPSRGVELERELFVHEVSSSILIQSRLWLLLFALPTLLCVHAPLLSPLHCEGSQCIRPHTRTHVHIRTHTHKCTRVRCWFFDNQTRQSRPLITRAPTWQQAAHAGDDDDGDDSDVLPFEYGGRASDASGLCAQKR